ncbi:hypothetical protein HK414_27510 [Ramlibacter terrae]|uniref:Uncharacterized protein n=1 Tax=Ramlibacter terrae TaxID=2732511 RepID=A0ABX6P7Y9_9BURK|nr:hypothetical protein HK414_27510 [Ramlibacter terrae]
MLLTRPAGWTPAAPPKPETLTQMMMAATVAVGCAAPLLTSLSRSGKAPPEAYLIFERLFFFNDYAGSLAMLVALVLALALPRVQEAVAHRPAGLPSIRRPPSRQRSSRWRCARASSTSRIPCPWMNTRRGCRRTPSPAAS